MGQLHDRNCRRAFAPAEAFQADALPAERFQSEMSSATAAGRALAEGALPGKDGDVPGAAPVGRAWGLLAHAPYLIPFRERAKLFQSVVAAERARHRDMEVMHSLAAEFGGAPNRFFAVRRTQVRSLRGRLGLLAGQVAAKQTGLLPKQHETVVCWVWDSNCMVWLVERGPPICTHPLALQTLQDAFEQLNNVGDALHGRIRIQVSEQGVPAAASPVLRALQAAALWCNQTGRRGQGSCATPSHV